MSPGRTLALDVGDRRIGLALTDPLNLTAQPLLTIHRSTLRADLKSIGRILRKHQVTTLVVGDPLHVDGTAGRQSERAQDFARALSAQHPDVTLHLLDERLTTQDAHALLDLRGGCRTAADRLRRKDHIDQLAATLILEAFLSWENGPALLPDPESEDGPGNLR